MEANRMRALFMLKYEGARLANRTFNDREISDFLSLGQQELIKQRFASFRNSKGIGYGGRADIPQSAAVRSAELAGLLSATQQISYVNMIGGTATNGALRNTDSDQQSTSQSATNYGTFCPIPDEAMYVLYEYADTCTNYPTTAPLAATGVRYGVDVLKTDFDTYRKGIRDYYAQPYDNLVWSVDFGSFTVQNSANGKFIESTKTNSTTGTGNNMTGTNAPGATTAVGYATNVEINTDRSVYLLPGKDRKVLNYMCSYLKRPKDIKVDVVSPASQINCELADFLHEEIVDYAVKLASAAIMPEQGKYQVNQLESKEDE